MNRRSLHPSLAVRLWLAAVLCSAARVMIPAAPHRCAMRHQGWSAENRAAEETPEYRVLGVPTMGSTERPTTVVVFRARAAVPACRIPDIPGGGEASAKMLQRCGCGDSATAVVNAVLKADVESELRTSETVGTDGMRCSWAKGRVMDPRGGSPVVFPPATNAEWVREVATSVLEGHRRTPGRRVATSAG